MRISDFGGEFRLIEALTRRPERDEVQVGVGDDAAVLAMGDDDLLVWTVDMLSEGDHFRTDWSSGRQVGLKAMNSNLSDIAAMGAKPVAALVSLSLTGDTEVEWVREVYEGFNKLCRKHSFDIVGGDTTHSSVHLISISVLGEVSRRNLCLRSHAVAGDLICVTGELGKSTAGLELLKAGESGETKWFLEGNCRLIEAQIIAPHANAMIDVSDGLASEVNHVCRQSGVGARINAEDVPLAENAVKTAKKLGHNPLDYALSGGEDFELVFTTSPENLEKIRLDCPLTVVGEITDKKGETVLVDKKDAERELTGGFNHFG